MAYINKFINNPEVKGIASIIGDADFSHEKSKLYVGEPLGKINLPSGLPYNVLNYGKAIILDNYNFNNLNLGIVNFTTEYKLQQINIYCFPEYFKDNKYQIIGLGTVLYPQYIPYHTWFDQYGVIWEVIEGQQYVTLHNIYSHEQDKYEGGSQNKPSSGIEESLRDNGCYVEINKWANNNKVIIQCWSNHPQTQNVGATIELYVTYDETTKTNELGHILILNNTDTISNAVADTEINLKVKYYPPNTTKRGFMVVDWDNPPYSLSHLYIENGINLDPENGPINYGNYDDKYYELYFKYKLWNDIIGDVGNPTWDKNTETYNIKLPRFILDDMKFYSVFVSKYKISFFNTYKTIVPQFNFKYLNLLQEPNIDLLKNVGYIPVLSDQMMMHFSLDKKIEKNAFKNLYDGSYLFTANIYTPQKLAKDKLGIKPENVFVVDVFVTSIKKQLEQLKEIKIYDNHKISKFECRSLYNEEDKKLYLIYNEELYNFTSRIFNVTNNTIIYNSGDLYKVNVNDDKTYDLKRIYTHETGYTKRVHTSIFDISYAAPGHDVPNNIPYKNLYYRGNKINSKYTALFSSTIKNVNNKSGLIGTYKNYLILHVLNGWNKYKGLHTMLTDSFNEFNLFTKINSASDIESTSNNNYLNIGETDIIIDDNMYEPNFSGKLYLNYGAKYGEYEDISNRYSSVYTLQKAIKGKRVVPNLSTGVLKNLIIYTKGSVNQMLKYTYWKNFPNSKDDLIKCRAFAEVDLRIDKLGNIVNVGTGGLPVITNIK